MSSENKTNFKHLLTTSKYHVTKSRIKIFEILNQNPPLSIRDILKHSNGSIDRVSLYRNIDLFEKLGIVQRVYIGWKYKLELTDYFVAHHHHLSCSSCGKVIDIKDEDDISKFISLVASKYAFAPTKHHFEIEGICSACKN